MPLDWSPTEKHEEARPATGHGSPAGRRRPQCHLCRPPRLGGIGACTGDTQPGCAELSRVSASPSRPKSRTWLLASTHTSGRATGRHGSFAGSMRWWTLFPGRSAPRGSRWLPGLAPMRPARRPEVPFGELRGGLVWRHLPDAPAGDHVACAADGDPAVRRWAAARAHSSTAGPASFQRGQRGHPAARVPMPAPSSAAALPCR